MVNGISLRIGNNYLIEVDASGMYTAWHNDDGKWIGVATCSTVAAAKKAIELHKGIAALEEKGE